MRRLRFGASGSKVLTLLAFASWLLLVVSWVMSVYAYHRLPAEMALWTSLWSSHTVRGAKSLALFFYPIVQTVCFLASLVLVKVVFFRAPGLDSEGRYSQSDGTERLLGLKNEGAYLGLIFLHLVFIHLQS